MVATRESATGGMAAQAFETVVLPRVSGRHRDRALASARKCWAIQLKLQGLGTGTGTAGR